MRTIFQLLGRSPFAPLQEHMRQVVACVEVLRPLFKRLEQVQAQNSKGGDNAASPCHARVKSSSGDVPPSCLGECDVARDEGVETSAAEGGDVECATASASNIAPHLSSGAGSSWSIDPQLDQLIKSISELEHLADLTKHDLRRKLARPLYLPVNRAHIFEVLSFQDRIADSSENIAQMLSYFPLEIHPQWKSDFFALLDAVIFLIEQALSVMGELDELLSSSFGGSEASRMDALIEQIAIDQSRCRDQQMDFARSLYAHWKDLPPPAFLLWDRIIEELGNMSVYTEKSVYKIRGMLNFN